MDSIHPRAALLNIRPEDKPAAVPTRCRCCNGTLDAQFQMGLMPNRPGYYLITCWNEGHCILAGYTFSEHNYLNRDLTDYGFIPACDKHASTEPTH